MQEQLEMQVWSLAINMLKSFLTKEYKDLKLIYKSFPSEESACQNRRQERHRFNPWSRKIPHAAEQLNPGTTTTESTAPGAATTEPMCHSYWSLHVYNLWSATGAIAMRTCTTTKEQPLLATKKPTQQRIPS